MKDSEIRSLSDSLPGSYFVDPVGDTYGTTTISAARCLAPSPLRSYFFVVFGELWPANSEATDKSTPWSKRTLNRPGFFGDFIT